MNRVEVLMEMKRRIEEQPSLAISEWQGTCKYIVGELASVEVKDLQGMDLSDVLRPGEKLFLPTELLIAAAATSFGLIFHLQAASEGITVDEAEIIFYGTLDKSGFLGVRGGRIGITKPMLTIKANSDAPKGKLAEMAAISTERSPILSSLNEEVKLHVL